MKGNGGVRDSRAAGIKMSTFALTVLVSGALFGCTPKPVLQSETAVSAAAENRVPSALPANYMENTIQTHEGGKPNSLFRKQIKDILIFQSGGWSGLPREAAEGLVDPTWPKAGRDAYLEKSQERYLEQLKQIRGLSQQIAIAHLIMPDEEAKASGYGTCWNGDWTLPEGCKTGEWRVPSQQHQDVLQAALATGLPVAPLISINNYDCLNCEDRGKLVLPKLKRHLEAVLSQPSGAFLKNAAGQIVVLLEGLPDNTKLRDQDRAAIRGYMNSRKDIFWIDNLLNEDGGPAKTASNVYRSAAVFDREGGIQRYLIKQWGQRYLWHFSARFAKKKSDLLDEKSQIPEVIRLEWLNIKPHNPSRYPVIISQWNEYAEFLMYEPSLDYGKSDYNYLKALLSQQP